GRGLQYTRTRRSCLEIAVIGKSISTVLSCCDVLLGSTSAALAAERGTAKGEGVIVKRFPREDPEQFRFAPKYSFVHRMGKAEWQTRWIALNDNDPGTLEWRGSTPDVDALQGWCGGSSAAFLLIELDAENIAPLKTECPGDRVLSVAMISVINGLPTVAVDIDKDDGKQISGRVVVGSGYCDGAYCEQQGEYLFDAVISR
ncbi:MAG: hypothetical protein ABI650_12255, partial [Dokdonella sp.]